MLVRLACVIAAALIVAACTSEDAPPPRSPLASPTPAGPAATAAPTDTPAATPTPTPTLTATATPAAPAGTATPDASAPAAETPGAPPESEGATSEQQLELVTGNAIELMAEWLGIPAPDLSVDLAEAVVWPDACLGVAQPGVVCAAVQTPGFRVLLRDALGGRHRVHAGGDGVMRWAGEAVLSATIVAVEGAAIRLGDLEGDHAIPGSDLVFGEEVTATDAPGTSYVAIAGPHRLAEGVSVAVALDPDPNGGPHPLIAWLVVLE